MGIQNSVARRLAAPDLTTTVLTMPLTGFAADVRSGTNLPVTLRRLASVAAMLGGGVLGATLVLHTSAAVTLGVTAGLILIVAGGAGLAMRRPGACAKPRPDRVDSFARPPLEVQHRASICVQYTVQT